jgi:hypothetical protein
LSFKNEYLLDNGLHSILVCIMDFLHIIFTAPLYQFLDELLKFTSKATLTSLLCSGRINLNNRIKQSDIAWRLASQRTVRAAQRAIPVETIGS